MLMSPNKGETAVHGCHCPGDMAVRMRKVMAIPRSWYFASVQLIAVVPYLWVCWAANTYMAYMREYLLPGYKVCSFKNVRIQDSCGYGPALSNCSLSTHAQHSASGKITQLFA